jgi:hypothetical protein
MKTFEQFINHKIYYRGAKTNELGKSSFDGMWCSSDYNVAAQYGKVWKYKIENANLLNTDNEKARIIEKYLKLDFQVKMNIIIKMAIGLNFGCFHQKV